MSKLLFSKAPIVIDAVLAEAIGVNEAIVLQQIHYWLENNKENNKNFQDGRYWTYNSIKNWHERYFPFISERTLKRVFNTLVETGLLVTGNYNKEKRDRTLWYSIDYKKLDEIYNQQNDEEGENALGQNGTMEDAKMEQCKVPNCHNGLGQNDPMDCAKMAQPLPETTTETTSKTTTENTSSLSSSLQKVNNEDGSICDTDFYNSDYQEVIEYFNKNIHEAAEVEEEKLKSWLEVMSIECVIYAIEAAVMADIKTMNYINKVLNSLFTSGVTNKEQLGKYIQDFESNRARINQNSNGPGKSLKDEYDHDVSKIRNMLGASKIE